MLIEIGFLYWKEQGGVLSGIEVFSYTGENTLTILPDPQILRPFGESDGK